MIEMVEPKSPGVSYRLVSVPIKEKNTSYVLLPVTGGVYRYYISSLIFTNMLSLPLEFILYWGRYIVELDEHSIITRKVIGKNDFFYLEPKVYLNTDSLLAVRVNQVDAMIASVFGRYETMDGRAWLL